jgi:hypothetical protein
MNRQEAARQAGMVVGGKKQGGRQRQEKKLAERSRSLEACK